MVLGQCMYSDSGRYNNPFFNKMTLRPTWNIFPISQPGKTKSASYMLWWDERGIFAKYSEKKKTLQFSKCPKQLYVKVIQRANLWFMIALIHCPMHWGIILRGGRKESIIKLCKVEGCASFIVFGTYHSSCQSNCLISRSFISFGKREEIKNAKYNTKNAKYNTSFLSCALVSVHPI